MSERHDRGPDDTRPYLCIPYWTTPLAPGGRWDDGQERPLPSAPGVTSWMCPGIHPGPYVPGQPLDVSVDVQNSGGGNSPAIATVVIYWANPTVGFAQPTFLAACTVVAPVSRTAPGAVRTPLVTGTIPAGAPAHVCLLAAVSNPQDKAGPVPDPIGDRHWAQRNLMAVQAAGGNAQFRFAVGNPFQAAGTFEVVLHSMDERNAALLARAFGSTAVAIPATLSLRTRDVPAGEAGRRASAPLRLGSREQMDVEAEVRLGRDLPRGQGVALEALLLDRAGERQVAGSLGILVMGG